MDLHIPTILIASTTVMAVMACAMLLSWDGKRRHNLALWWGLPFLMGICAAVVLTFDAVEPSVLLKRFGMLFILLGYGFMWQASRAFYGRRHRVKAVLATALSWFVCAFLISYLPLTFSQKQIFLGLYSNALVLFYMIAMLREFKRSHELLRSREHMILLSWLLIAFYSLRFLLSPWLPAPLGSEATTTWAVAVYNFVILVQTVGVTMIVIVMSRERIAATHLHQAETDQLTGALNRRTLDSELSQLIRQSQQYRETFSVLIFDLDNFKSINDRFGHQVGDQVIARAAETARKSLRVRDKLFRLGGEEFLCLLADTTQAEAEQVAERLRLSYADEARMFEGELVLSTMSIGVASAVRGEHQSATELVKQADQALYQAKRNGRNQVVVARRREERPTV